MLRKLLNWWNSLPTYVQETDIRPRKPCRWAIVEYAAVVTRDPVYQLGPKMEKLATGIDALCGTDIVDCAYQKVMSITPRTISVSSIYPSTLPANSYVTSVA